MNFKEIVRIRVSARLVACKDSARLVIEALDKNGVKSVLFGSVMRGDVHTGSDIDILILVPMQPETTLFGAMANSVKIERDIVSPLDNDWEA